MAVPQYELYGPAFLVTAEFEASNLAKHYKLGDVINFNGTPSKDMRPLNAEAIAAHWQRFPSNASGSGPNGAWKFARPTPPAGLNTTIEERGFGQYAKMSRRGPGRLFR
jgi:hypothetical protein